MQSVARRELDSEDWLRLAATVGGRSLERMRVLVLEFLDAEVYDLSNHSCGSRQPTKLYYYRALQSLRDPIHFRREADEAR